ncbi:hypothetical protein QUB68_29810, partial [Microcoleus sp. A006_D1]|uniref:hypothetical protein n=1 Tax=Microcoleus sp. A006_D1 TaxID=3055267 RepID=UPI002FD43EA9
MQQKPPTALGRSHLFTGKDSRSIGALKLRAEELGLTHYAKLYGDKRYTATWQKLLENEPDLQPLQPRHIEKSSTINWKLAIALFVGALALIILLRPIRNAALPIHINIQIGEKK